MGKLNIMVFTNVNAKLSSYHYIHSDIARIDVCENGFKIYRGGGGGGAIV